MLDYWGETDRPPFHFAAIRILVLTVLLYHMTRGWLRQWTTGSDESWDEDHNVLMMP